MPARDHLWAARGEAVHTLVARDAGGCLAQALAKGASAVYVNYCHQCGEALSSERDPRCPKCDWLICECGACGCSYHVAAAHAALAGVARVWAPVAQPSRGRFPWQHVPRPLWLAIAVGLLAAGLLGASMILGGPSTPPAETVQATLVPTTVPAIGSPVVGAVTLEPAPAVEEEQAVAATAEPTGAATAPPASASAASAAASRPAPAPTLVPTAIPTFRPTPAAPRPTIPPDPAMARLAIGPIPPTFGPTSRATGGPATSGDVLYVANTGGVGAYLRSHPRDGNDTRLVAWTEGTPMVALETQTVTGPNGPEVWVHVRDPNGQSGWIKQAYLAQRR